jgi:hypothetical protein
MASQKINYINSTDIVHSPVTVICGKDDKQSPEKHRNINQNTLLKVTTKSPHQILPETPLLLIHDEELDLRAGLSYSYSMFTLNSKSQKRYWNVINRV